MSFLKDIFEEYNDRWYYALVGNHKEKSFLRFFEIYEKTPRIYIKAFSYYPKTKKVSYSKISTINHLNYIKEVIDMDEDTNLLLDALYAKELLNKKN